VAKYLFSLYFIEINILDWKFLQYTVCNQYKFNAPESLAVFGVRTFRVLQYYKNGAGNYCRKVAGEKKLK
jgi:hypothetical protein